MHVHPTASLIAVLALLGSLAAQSKDVIQRSLDAITMESLNVESRNLDRVIEGGDEWIDALKTKLGLTVVQPEFTLVPPDDRVTESTGEILFGFKFTNKSNKPAVVRSKSISANRDDYLVRARTRVRYQTYGFTWDAGGASAILGEARLQNPTSGRILKSDEEFELRFRIPAEIRYAGRYTVDVDFTYGGHITIPQDEKPDWPGKATFQIDYLPMGASARRTQIGGSGDLRVRVEDQDLVYRVGQTIDVNVKVTNPGKERLILPDPKSFYAAPLWFIVLKDERIMTTGSVLPMEHLITSGKSTAIREVRLGAKESLTIPGSLVLRLPEGRYTAFVGYTVERDLGRQLFWQGETISNEFTFTMIERAETPR